MPELTQSALLAYLDRWEEYVDKFNRLPADRQAAFLHEQGFPRLRDLLAHIIGWWEEGIRIVESVLSYPDFVYNEPDTDAFNATVVEKYSSWREASLFQYFEQTRRRIVDMVSALPEAALENPLIREWLIADVIEHFDEHKLPSS